MRTYRFYFLVDDRIRAVETFDCEDDASAAKKAGAFLEDRHAFEAVEVWSGKTLVHRQNRN